MKPSRRTAAAIAVLAAVTAAAIAGPATAAPGGTPTARSGLFNSRYCEILVVKGKLPAVNVTVWNTIGLNLCPAAQWTAFDAPTLTAELGAAGVVLNGPRHWLMDVASDSYVGKVRTFGSMRLREVAKLRITTAAGLIQTPYETRVVDRTNRWTWKPGRTVYELVAPGGAVYVMQAYSQIVDPNLRLGRLRSLGSRLKLPAGWRYRSRTLRGGLALQAHGRATILQDELQNTYQLLPAAR